MPQNQLGFFDTPPGRREIWLGVAIVGVLLAALLVMAPIGGQRLLEIPSFIPVIDSMMCLGDLIAATVLYTQASVFRSRALLALATGYLYTALLLVPHALTFPGAFAPDGLLGAGTNSTTWIAIFRRLGFPVATILYVVLKQRDAELSRSEGPAERIGPWVLAAFALAAVATAIAIGGHEFLPHYYVNRTELIYSTAVAFEIPMLLLYGAAATLLFRNRSSVLDWWLLVAFGCWLIQSLLILTLQGRFTVGFYWLQLTMLFSHMIVMLALIAETNRLYARLALAMVARNREANARQMSLDAVAAAITHEIGQPLTAIRLQARSAKNRLTADRPNIGHAIQALDAIAEAEERTSSVLTSVRGMFAKRKDARTEFDLNDLIRSTVTVMDLDLAAHDVALDCILDESLPPVLADPVQIQRVLVSLLTNAIEALDPVRDRFRRITIHSAMDDQGVLLEVSDNGVGISPETMERLFEVFFTTKSKGRGLGLSLCRIIIESCGGSLWASRGMGNGATFHLQLPAGG